MKMKYKKSKLGVPLYLFLFVLTYVALLFMASPWLQPWIIMQNVEQFQLHQFSAEELIQNRATVEPTYEDFYDIVEPDLRMVLSQITEVSSNDVIGGIVIPDVDIQLPILAGTTHYNLLVGATTIDHNITMGEGNFVLVGHNMSHGGILFSRLLDISDDAHIHVTDGAYIHIYRVVETAVIHQNEISVIEPTEEAMITLITCDQPTVWTQNRFMVRGELISTHDINSDSLLVHPIQQAMNGSQASFFQRNAFTLSLIGIGGCSGMIILGLIMISIRDRKKLERS